VLPRRQRASTAAGRLIPVHAGSDARVPAVRVPAQATAASGIEVLVLGTVLGFEKKCFGKNGEFDSKILFQTLIVSNYLKKLLYQKINHNRRKLSL
jgi:hypothetical protein